MKARPILTFSNSKSKGTGKPVQIVSGNQDQEMLYTKNSLTPETEPGKQAGKETPQRCLSQPGIFLHFFPLQLPCLYLYTK